MNAKNKKLMPLLLVLLAVVLIGVFIIMINRPADQDGSALNNKSENQLTVYDAETPDPNGTAETTPQATEQPTATPSQTEPSATQCPVSEDGVYDTKDEVALYIHLYGHLPSNFITKKEAQELGWTGGSLEPYAPGKCIGGDYFGNYEGQLPTKKGRSYHECDIGTLGKSSRGAKRIVFSNDGLIYYTDDHYETFTLLYGGDD